MRRIQTLAGVLVAALAAGTSCAAMDVASTESGLIPPPAISIPYGGKIVTEINLSDNDVLGMIKQIIPAVGEVAATVMPMAASAAKGPIDARAMSAVGSIDFQGLADAISGITNVRLLVVKYAATPKMPELMKQLDGGVAKLGRFSRVVSDVGMIPGLLALYAQADGGGYVGYAFNSGERSLYAARVVGSADMSKLTKWVVDTAKSVIGVRATESEESESEPESDDVAAPAETPDTETP